MNWIPFIPVILKVLEIFLEGMKLFWKQGKDAVAVKQEFPDQPVSVINVVQHSANKAIENDRQIIEGPVVMKTDPAMKNIETITASDDFKRIEAGK